MLHRNAKLTPAGRRLLVDRIASGRPVAHVAAEMGVARQTAHRWWRRFVAEGESGLQDRSCRPRRSPRRTPRALERRIERLRRRQKLGPVRIGYRLGLAASTVYRVLCRLGLQRLSWLDRPTGRVIRRYEHPHPGDLLHMDIKKLGRIPPGGGWRAHGRGRAGARQRVGYAYIHSAVDDHSRLAYSEVLADERAVTVVAFWRRALAWFADRGVTAQAVLTDNGSAYRSADFARACLAAGIRHRRTRPYRPQTNGKVERFNRTLLEGMGLRSRLPLRAGTHGRARALAAPLQSPPRSHRPRRSTSAQPCHQPPGTVQLALDAPTEIVLFRVAQEAVGNALQHSGTDRVRVSLRAGAGEALMTVQDWGSGIDPTAAAVAREEGHHLGLVGMRERAELLGGSFAIETVPGKGTTISVRVPATAGVGATAERA